MSTWASDYKEMGSPAIVNGTVRKVAKGVDLIYVLTENGGSGHIVFDDGNYDDDAIDFCLAIEEWGPFTKDHIEFVREVLTLFKSLTTEERWSAMALQGSRLRDPNRIQDENYDHWRNTVFVDEFAPVYDMTIGEIRKLWESL